ncbi:MAG: DUF937 domain-containing protein [Gammaproteobacteria bacterium]|jgi:hypothetical protein|nr:DUF937 domain-containing protein [Gammaproteobacteria bacterium]
MSLMQMLQQLPDGQTMHAWQQQTGADSAQLQSAAQATLPMLLGALTSKAKQQSVSGGLLNMLLDDDGDGQVSADEVHKRGGGLLGRFFGSR